MMVNLNSIKLSPRDEGPKKDQMRDHWGIERTCWHVLSELQKNLECTQTSIQNAGPVESMTDAKQTIIMQEFQIYVLGIEDSVKKK